MIGRPIILRANTLGLLSLSGSRRVNVVEWRENAVSEPSQTPATAASETESAVGGGAPWTCIISRRLLAARRQNDPSAITLGKPEPRCISTS